MSEDKLIDWRLYDPTNSLFKSNANEKASFKRVFCKNTENCELYKKGTCVLSDTYGKCHYGYTRREEGYSKRARKFHTFLSEKRKIVENIPQLSTPPKKMARIDEYVYFPYSHWSYENNNIPESLRTGFASRDISVIPYETFSNVDFLNTIFNHRPLALFGGVITSYYDEVAKMKQHLKEEFPEIYNVLIIKYPEHTLKELNPVGRKALINTLPKGTKFHIKYYGDFEWDGEYVISTNFSFGLFPIKGNMEVKITPKDSDFIEIVSVDQVGEGTKFIN